MAEKVRSRIYQELIGLKKEFVEHLNATWELTHEQRSALLDSLPSIIRAKTDRELVIARQRAVQAIGGSEIDAMKAATVMAFIGGCWNPIRDEVDSVLEDFEDLGLLPTEPEHKNDVLKFLRSFFEFMKSDSIRSLDKNFTRMLLPSLTRVDIAVDFRSVIESEFDWRKDNPDEYKPTIQRTVPVAILKFVLDEGEPAIFQVNQEELEMTIRRLQATLREIDAGLKTQSGSASQL